MPDIPACVAPRLPLAPLPSGSRKGARLSPRLVTRVIESERESLD
jgi:hypothetical protein